MVLAVCNVYVRSVGITGSRREGVEGGEIDGEQVLVHYECWQENLVFLVYFSKRGAYWDRLCRDVVGCNARALWPNGAS